MWDIFICDNQGIFQANTKSLDLASAEYFLAQLDKDLVAFLFPASCSRVSGLSLLVDP
jgi:hypothetical protein